jgi:hypothetical protein
MPNRMHPYWWLKETYQRQSTLAVFGLFWWLCLIPLSIAYALDPHILRGTNIWLKPIKFALSLGLFSLYTAWFFGLLKPEFRKTPALNFVVWGIVAAGTFENVYISLQAWLGQASHFNNADLFHGLMYGLMGIGACTLTATQAVLAIQIHRHSKENIAIHVRSAVVLGLALTFLLGTLAGALLSGKQPPSGEGIALFGWHLSGADLRPAHFLGIHAQQFFPLAAFAFAAGGLVRPKLLMQIFSGIYVAAWTGLFVRGIINT